MSDFIPRAGFFELFLWAIGRRRRFVVEGHSMMPLLNPGEEVLIADMPFPFKVGDTILFLHPQNPDLLILKRIDSIMNDALFLRGANPSDSLDSRSFGPVPLPMVKGVVTSRFF